MKRAFKINTPNLFLYFKIWTKKYENLLRGDDSSAYLDYPEWNYCIPQP